ncbi:hypothetical protein [Tunturiibacter gelidoferens]|uniref:Uncharacterized protein n=1 Tax=Tunturiibacter gelidiferens TaxID=3069689 RepID=A0A9X0U6S0_9BACT|nr:hypothetical protein [Edaphobacter lichenicola]MBB5331881.1 hypothetical protein [Edaphobacter lichenicola]
MNETVARTKLFFLLRNLHDLISQQQQQLDVIAESHFKLCDVARNKLGMAVAPSPSPPSPSPHAAIVTVKGEIDKLEQLFNELEKKEKR